MNKSLIALAALGAFAGAASAQSSVTIFGKMDLGIGQAISATVKDDKAVMDAAGSRIGFRGVEDLGNGYKAVFAIEHRLSPDSGTSASANFWNGFSTVGLVTPMGMVNLGRQYTPAFTMMQNQIDPFGGDTQAAGRGVGMITGGIAKVRVADSIRYDLTVGGFNLGASIAESNTNGGTDKPVSLAANYSAGPFWVGFGYENPAANDDKVWNIGGRYNFGFATVSLGYGKGTTATNLDAKSWLLGVNVPVGAFDLKAMYAVNDTNGIETKKAGIGAHYNLSKRTKLYADYGKVGGMGVNLFAERSGYDFGVQHNF